MEGDFVGIEARIAVVEIDVVATGERQLGLSFDEIFLRLVKGRLDDDASQGFVTFTLILCSYNCEGDALK